MTEEEAKGKWCPHVRDADENLGTWNRLFEGDGIIHERSQCIGSKCMAWRKTETYYFKPKGEPAQIVNLKPSGDGCEYFEMAELNHYGYCGLAGKP